MPIDTIRRPYTRIEQAQVVIDLCCRPHCRTGVFTGRFLVDGNGWTQAVNGVHIWFFHISQELPGIGR